jgi:flagellar M-ring protein FliF
MGFLNRAVAQLNDLFKSLTPGTRVIASLLLAAVVVALAFLFAQGVSGGGKDYLMAGENFSPDELHAMEAALGKAGLPYEFEGAKIRVPRGRQHEYMAALAKEKALPSSFGDYLERAAASDPLATGKTIDHRRQVAKQKELGALMGNFGGVQRVSVVYDEKNGIGFGSKAAATASVTVRMEGTRTVTEDLATNFQELVAHAYAGLEANQVVVFDESNGRSFGGGSGPLGNGAGNEYFKAKLAYARVFEEKARQALQFVPGVVVTADVELNPEIERHQQDNKADPKATLIHSIESTQSTKMDSTAPGGRPGLAAQAGNQAAKIDSSSKGSSSTTKGPDTIENDFAISKTLLTSRTVGLTPQDVRLVVSVPQSYIESEWRAANEKPDDARPETPEDKAALAKTSTDAVAAIRDHLRVLVPDKLGTEDPTPNIQVTVFRDVAIEPIPEEGVASQAMSWIAGNWTTVGMLGLAGLSLLFVRSLAKSGAPAPRGVLFEMPATPAPAAAHAPAVHGAAGGAAGPPSAEEPSAPLLPGRRRRTGLTLRDELVELVREDPESAAGILRSWIGNTN